MRRRNVALLYAIVHQRINFIGFVKYRIHPQLGAAHAHVRRSIIAQDHYTLMRMACAARSQHSQAAALTQKKVNDGQIPLGFILCKPQFAFILGFCNAYGLNESKLFQSSNEVLSNSGVVFNDVGFKFHCRIRCMVYR